MKNRARILLTLVASLLVGLAAAEIGLRALGVEATIFKRADPVCGTSYIPGAKGRSGGERPTYIEINSAGFRDLEHSLEKPPGTFRIAVLGDSYSAAFQVPLEHTFWSVMERTLNSGIDEKDRDIEVLNFGVSGYGTAQEYLLLHHKVWNYSPDLVLLAVCTGNDISDNHRMLKGADYIPYYVYEDGKLALDRSFRGSRAYRLRENWFGQTIVTLSRFSRLLQLANQVRLRLQTLEQEQLQERHLGVDSEELGLDSQIYMEPKDNIWREAWSVTEGIILMMHQEVQRKGARLAVVTLSNGIQVHPDAQIREVYTRRRKIVDLFYPDYRIRRFCSRNGISGMCLAPLLQSYSQESGTFLHGFGEHLGSGHWNEEGHRQAGELIAGWLLSDLLAQPREQPRKSPV